MPLLVWLALAAPVFAQSAEETPTFKSGVSNVRVDVLALEKNRVIKDLRQDDFIVLEQGRPQPITYFGHESEPLSLVLLLDVSGSMKKYVEQVASVSRNALRFLRPRDRVSIMIFARDSRVALEWTDDMSRVASELGRGFTGEDLGAGTNINDALLEAAEYIEETAGDGGRRAVLILTDNLGLNYKSPDEPVIAALNEADAVLNAIVVGKGRRPEPVSGGTYRNPDFTSPDVFLLSEQTGGEAVRAEKAGEAFSNLIERIRTRYSLHYSLPEGPSGLRTITVQLTPEARKRYPDAVLRHRSGYRATSR